MFLRRHDPPTRDHITFLSILRSIICMRHAVILTPHYTHDYLIVAVRVSESAAAECVRCCSLCSGMPFIFWLVRTHFICHETHKGKQQEKQRIKHLHPPQYICRRKTDTTYYLCIVCIVCVVFATVNSVYKERRGRRSSCVRVHAILAPSIHASCCVLTTYIPPGVGFTHDDNTREPGAHVRISLI